MWSLHRIILCCFAIRFSEEILQLNAVNDPNNNGQYYIANAVKQTIVESLLDCARLCLDSTRCLSYFHNSGSNECILHAISFRRSLSSSGTGWKYFLTDDRSSRCPLIDEFVYYRRLNLCYTINGPIRADFDVINSTCQSFGAELVRIDSEEKQQYIVQATSHLSTGKVCMQGTNTKDMAGKWTFDDGTYMSYFNWNVDSNEPKVGRGFLGMNIEMGATWKALMRQMPDDCIFICEKR